MATNQPGSDGRGGWGPGPELEHVRWASRPTLDRPVVLVAFEGWSDAGDAASSAVRYIGEQHGAEPFATIDPEVFFDFSSTRPRVQFDDDLQREIVWPDTVASSCSVDDLDTPLVTIVGNEPQLRWRTFAEQIVGIARHFDARLVLTFGALLAEVPHSRPVSVFGTADDTELADTLGLLPSRYEGPTGMTGVLQSWCRQSGLRSAALWAAVPTYVPSAPSPKAALALVERASQLLDIPVETTELEIAAASYERQVSELVSGDAETTEYVEQLERRFDEDDHSPFAGDEESLVDEVERFLRDQRD
ncbi:MAG TPA: PAC2 family protein [Acidimicrobiales bacterium]|nr:PAC2 family protein [Acidimicrobiales bacterium]